MFGWFTSFFAVKGPDADLGRRGELEAARFLERAGYSILHRQLRNRYGELDLVARDRDTIVFVEVKTRASTGAGHPTEAITPAKQKKMTRAALTFLKKHGWLKQRARFDVISIIWPLGREAPEVRHFINAFDAVGFGQMFS